MNYWKYLMHNSAPTVGLLSIAIGASVVFAVEESEWLPLMWISGVSLVLLWATYVDYSRKKKKGLI